MIVRAPSDAAVIDDISRIANDERLSLDTRAVLIGLMACRTLDLMPKNAELQASVIEKGRPIGSARFTRIMREARAAGYVIRPDWHVPRRRGRWAYASAFMMPEVGAE